jgi:hypothetical protein
MRIGHIVPLIAKRYINEPTRKRALFLKGKSGIGKSDAVRQASALLAQHIPNWQGVIDQRLSQKEPTDMAGLPYVQDGKTHYARPAFLPEEGTSGIIFFDEITSAAPAVQAAAYQYILDRCLGEHKIPDGWMIVTAGNLTSDRGVTFQIAAPLLNRMCEITVSTVLEDFIQYAIPAGLKPEIASFLHDRSEFLHKFEGKGAIEPFPSPRSWFAVSDDMDLKLQPEDRIELFKGEIGHEAATTFETHLRYFETLPRIADILEGKPVTIPADIGAQYAIGMGIASRVSVATFDNAWKVLEKMGGDIQTLTVKLAYKRDKGMVGSPAFTAWAAANQSAFKRV